MSTEVNYNKKTFDQVVLDRIDKAKEPVPKKREPNCWERTDNACKKRLMGTGCCLATVLVFALILINQNNQNNQNNESSDDQFNQESPSPSPYPQATVSASPTPSASASASTLLTDDDSSFLELELELWEVILGILGISFFALLLICCYCKCKSSHDQRVRVAPRQIVYDVED